MFGMINMINQGAVNRQQGIFTNRLVDGTKSGQLNKSEYMALANYDQDTREMEGKFLKDGNISWQERQILEQRNKYNERMLSLYSRGEFNPMTQGPQNEIEARMQNQLSRTYDGITDGSLTRGEAVNTLNYQGETATKYGKMQASPNGFTNWITGTSTFTAGERFALNNRLNNSSQQIFNMRHNWASDWGAPQNVTHFQPHYGTNVHGGGMPSFPSYTPPVNFPSYPPPSMIGGQPPYYPGFPSGGCPPYLSPFTQQLFNTMAMGMMMGMMGGMGFGMPLEMMFGGMPMAMPFFMGLSNMMAGMNMGSGMMGGMNMGYGMMGGFPGSYGGSYGGGSYAGAYAGVGPYGAYAGAYAGNYGGVIPQGVASNGSGSAAVAMGRQFLGRESWSIKGQMPHFTAAGGQTNNCADFVSSCLESQGLIRGHHVNVRELEQSLLRQGYRPVPLSMAKPGDVWINASRGHTELVQGFDPQRGGVSLIGSNNDRPGHQVISNGFSRSGVVYTRG